MQAYQAKFLLFLRKIGVFAQTVVGCNPEKGKIPLSYEAKHKKMSM